VAENIDADDLPAEVKESFDAMVEAEAIHSITSSARARKVGGTSRPKRAAQRSVLAGSAMDYRWVSVHVAQIAAQTMAIRPP
jgi:hypothetical protein